MNIQVVLCWLVMMTCCLAPRMASAEAMQELLAGKTPASQAAVDRGLKFLRGQAALQGQNVDLTANTVVNRSLALMAHLAAGITPADPQHGPWMRDALQVVMQAQEPSGYFGAKDGSRMYGHGITTLMLAEMLGMTDDDQLDAAIRQHVSLAITLTQHAAKVEKKREHQGGWRYQPHENTSDLSLSGWQLMSLHACQQVGLQVDKKVVAAACDYAFRLMDKSGRVGYQKPGSEHAALRGLGLLCLAIGGREKTVQVDRVAQRMLQDPISWRGPWFYYRSYYDAVGLSRARPRLWQQYRQTLHQVLIDHQDQNGSWPSPPGDNEAAHGRIYCTSMAILALTVDHHVLPAYQR